MFCHFWKSIEGRKGNCPHMPFLGSSYGQHRASEGFFAQVVTGGTGVNGLNYWYTYIVYKVNDTEVILHTT